MAKTPVDKWNAQLAKYRKATQTIIGLSKNIRYAGVLNAYGRTLTGVIRPELKPLLSSKQIRDEFSIISTLISLRNDITIDTIGRLSYVKFEHQKVTVLVLQKKNVTYYVTVNRKEKDLEKIISEIKKTI